VIGLSAALSLTSIVAVVFGGISFLQRRKIASMKDPSLSTPTANDGNNGSAYEVPSTTIMPAITACQPTYINTTFEKEEHVNYEVLQLDQPADSDHVYAAVSN